ncbi:hypothetical protein K32_42260 [Kaistia sp. 32K]|uniref:hypothetical protein n=1 Tax=Kaistia sp. 32K TaxID=2795690 RepID=UPI001916497B|nr:hypothetical protein [Kaistia sp. 32K]BCP55609.1 hypothetical protein K32_42260 [Kaistia sp. 32K]
MEEFDEALSEQSRGRKGLRVNNEDAPSSIFLDPWLTAKGAPLVALVDHLMLITMPDTTKRTRSLRHDAAQRRRFVMGNIAANLVHLALGPSREEGGLLAIATAKTKPTRYDREDYPQGILAGSVAALEDAGMLVCHPYVFKQRTTTVEPTPAFVAWMHRHGVRLADIGRDAGGETIWLRAREDENGETLRRRQYHNQTIGKTLVQYDDTEETERLRAEVERLNKVLNGADIAYAGEPIGPLALRRSFLLRSPHAPQEFNLNGRIAGGFWQTLKTRKRHLITIGGEDIADLDYVSMFAMLTYLKATGSLPVGDPYDIPGLEKHRDGAKLAMISLLSRKGDMQLLAPKLKAALPEGWTARRLVEAMTLRHPAIAHLFGRDIGIELMHTESRVLMAVLLELADRGIPALPMHDGINVKWSDRAKAMEVMQSVSAKLLGVALPVKEKPIRRPQAALAA